MPWARSCCNRSVLACATVKLRVTGAASAPPAASRNPVGPAGMVSDSVEVGVKAAVAAKVTTVALVFFQAPGTGGLNGGRPATVVIGAESWTVTVASEATLVAPVAGVVETTLRGGAAMVVEWPEGGVAR